MQSLFDIYNNYVVYDKCGDHNTIQGTDYKPHWCELINLLSV